MILSGYPCLQLSSAHGIATVSLHGGQLLSWIPVGQRDVLWLSPQTLPAPAAIRGGVPVCWPWFSKQGMPQGAMQHGPVRHVMWQKVACGVTDAGHALLSLEPDHDGAALQTFAKDLRLRLEFELGETLVMRLQTQNQGLTPFALTQALHTYFAVGDVEKVELQGVEGLHYASRIDGMQNNLQSGPFHLNALCDNTYAQTSATDSYRYQLLDPAWERAITIDTRGSSSLVVWNPGAEGAKNMIDVPDTGWANFLCVEATNAGHDTILLAPGAQHVLQQTLRCASLDAPAHASV